MQLLVELGASVRVKDAQGQTPLHWAAQRGHAKICEWLLRYRGAEEDVNTQCNCFLTPLYYAAKEGHREVCRVLQNHGADFGDFSQWNNNFLTLGDLELASHMALVHHTILSSGRPPRVA